ncbi:glycosyltransferase family A protein [Flavobacterium sp. JAS]|uniref:glycosyltransferase family 2 protein n=1 Tax=Flavobacterium sp. JAS TaxID=2897329 RepID=UPI001E2CA9AD|nr:glycosyltransferase family A protein [Flavobacterium sp. JAS]MCD0471088.1 glycosyltransferase family 2 protein [Flavobacterium sp. JAS]
MKSNSNCQVSVIIPCYNDHKYIQEAVNSINNQTHKNVEIIIIDDGSDSTTHNVLKTLEQENLTIIYQENSGPSSARNTGIKQAKGDYILTLDADDFFDSVFISKALDYLTLNNKVGLVSCWIKTFNDEGIMEMFKPGGGDLETLILGNGASGNYLFRKKCWLDVGGYDENMRKGYEDWEFNISVVKAGWEIKIIEEYLFNYRKKSKSRNSEADKFHKYELWRYIYKKHKDLWNTYHELMIDNVFLQMEALEMGSQNLRKTIDYKLGKMFLMPFRFIKKRLL